MRGLRLSRGAGPAGAMSVDRLRARLDRAGTALLPAVAYGDCAGSPFEGEPAQANTGSRLLSYADGMAGLLLPVSGLMTPSCRWL